MFGVVLLGAAIGIYLALSSSKKVTELSLEDKVKEEQRIKMQQEQADQIKVMADKIKELELSKATADEAQKKVIELEKQRLEEQKRKKEDEQVRMKVEDEKRKLDEAERLKKEETDKLAQDELEKKKKEEEALRQQEIEKKRVEAARVKEGDLISLNDITAKPEKISGNPPSISATLKNKYKGNTMTVPAMLLIDENGNVTKIRILAGNVAPDIKAVLEDSLSKWKYTPAMKDNVKVKVWLTVSIRLSF